MREMRAAIDFVFPNGLGEFEVDELAQIDQPLLTIFKTRVCELADL